MIHLSYFLFWFNAFLSAHEDAHLTCLISLFDHFLVWFDGNQPDRYISIPEQIKHHLREPAVDYWSCQSSSSESNSPLSSPRLLRVDDYCLLSLLKLCRMDVEKLGDAWRILTVQRPEWNQVCII